MYKNTGIDVIYCSPMTRTTNTIKALAKQKDLEIIFDDRLCEIQAPGNQDAEYATNLQRNDTLI